jgi:hypothetical protein
MTSKEENLLQSPTNRKRRVDCIQGGGFLGRGGDPGPRSLGGPHINITRYEIFRAQEVEM